MVVFLWFHTAKVQNNYQLTRNNEQLLGRGNAASTAILHLSYSVEPLWSHCSFGVASVWLRYVFGVI